jgi:acetyl-CoA synthetase
MQMSEVKTYPVSKEWAARAFIDAEKYREMYRRSVDDPENFWAEQAKRVDWMKPFTRVKNVSYAWPDISIKWFEDGALNVSANCIDRHLKDRAGQVAIIWEGDDSKEERKITYRELHAHVGRLANVLKARGVKRGDRVTIYMPMIPEAAYAMLACARIGAIHSVVFGGFSPDSLANRIEDCRSDFVITADEGIRGGKLVPLKANTDKAIE